MQLGKNLTPKLVFTHSLIEKSIHSYAKREFAAPERLSFVANLPQYGPALSKQPLAPSPDVTMILIADIRANYLKWLLSWESGHNVRFTWSNTVGIPNITSDQYEAILVAEKTFVIDEVFSAK